MSPDKQVRRRIEENERVLQRARQAERRVAREIRASERELKRTTRSLRRAGVKGI